MLDPPFALKFVPDQTFLILSPGLHCDSGTRNAMKIFECVLFLAGRLKFLVDSARVL